MSIHSNHDFVRSIENDYLTNLYEIHESYSERIDGSRHGRKAQWCADDILMKIAMVEEKIIELDKESKAEVYREK